MSKKGINIVLIVTFLFIGIYIGIFIGRQTASNLQSIPNSEASKSSNDESYRLNLNTVTVEQLMQIPGIGQEIATRIIEYRDEYGDYVDVDELLDIPGISDELFKNISRYFTVGG